MLREPYNMNPYNSTIDTSLTDGNEFSFYFSGDRLGKYAFEIKDYDTAVKWLTFTAKKNVPKSLYLLALCYKDGLGVPVDLAQAKELMIKASDLNYPGAMDEIAKINEAIKKKAEDSKVAIRSIRRDAIDKLKKMQKNSEIIFADRKKAHLFPRFPYYIPIRGGLQEFFVKKVVFFYSFPVFP